MLTGISISVSSPDGHVLGGAVGGRLIAASPVQVVKLLLLIFNLLISYLDSTSLGFNLLVLLSFLVSLIKNFTFNIY